MKKLICLLVIFYVLLPIETQAITFFIPRSTSTPTPTPTKIYKLIDPNIRKMIPLTTVTQTPTSTVTPTSTPTPNPTTTPVVVVITATAAPTVATAEETISPQPTQTPTVTIVKEEGQRWLGLSNSELILTSLLIIAMGIVIWLSTKSKPEE